MKVQFEAETTEDYIFSMDLHDEIEEIKKEALEKYNKLIKGMVIERKSKKTLCTGIPSDDFSR